MRSVLIMRIGGYCTDQYLLGELVVCRLLQGYAVFTGRGDVKIIDNFLDPTAKWKSSGAGDLIAASSDVPSRHHPSLVSFEARVSLLVRGFNISYCDGTDAFFARGKEEVGEGASLKEGELVNKGRVNERKGDQPSGDYGTRDGFCCCI
ncbi:hypothetical protein ACLOJK_029229 [Asimina triloba]